jgi:3-deoxy-D-manno-octulosonate 8-phosphate phosphatase KdsC-like HAD superfamily phosphatase
VSALSYEASVLARAQAVKVAFFDVDGVLTDGGLLYGETGETLKRFHTLDGHGGLLAVQEQKRCTWTHIISQDARRA